MEESNPRKKGPLSRRNNSPYWYVRFTGANGRRIQRSTRRRSYEKALLEAERLIDLEMGMVSSNWERHIRAAKADSKSWLRELTRKVRHRDKSGRPMKPKDVVDVALRSGGYCELTGIPFSLENPTTSNVPPFKPSLDRIDSSKPYSYGNCRLIIVAANLALRDWGDAVFKQMCVGYASRVLAQDARADVTKSVTPINWNRTTKRPET